MSWTLELTKACSLSPGTKSLGGCTGCGSANWFPEDVPAVDDDEAEEEDGAARRGELAEVRCCC